MIRSHAKIPFLINTISRHFTASVYSCLHGYPAESLDRAVLTSVCRRSSFPLCRESLSLSVYESSRGFDMREAVDGSSRPGTGKIERRSSPAATSSRVPPGVSKTFYKRELPCPPAVAFSSEEGQKIFAKALASGSMQSFFQLIEHFRTQDEPAFCGLASVAMVLNALSVDPRRPWKGNWRYFSEGMLDCCTSLEKVARDGITLEEAACLARCNGASVGVYRYGSVTLDEFRTMIKNACGGNSSQPEHIVVSYSRQAFQQTGTGHFSPLAGISEEHDMVLILDTARFKYPPHWVKVEDLYHAMEPHDPTTGLSRGFMTLSSTLLESALFTLGAREEDSLHLILEYLSTHMSAIVAGQAKEAHADCVNQVLKSLLSQAPVHAIQRALAVRTVGARCKDGVCTQTSVIETFLLELRSMPLYKQVKGVWDGISLSHQGTTQNGSDALDTGGIEDKTIEMKSDEYMDGIEALKNPKESSFLLERLCMLLLLAPQSTWDAVPSADTRDEILRLMNISGPLQRVVAHEIAYLRHQLDAMRLQTLPDDTAMKDGAPGTHNACAE